MARDKHSWLDGPQIPAENEDPLAPAKWPGERLGLPEKGYGALASVMRRVGGIALDWVVAMLATVIVTSMTDALGGFATVELLMFFIISVISVTLFARTPGQAMMKMGVARIDRPDQRVGFVRALVRAVLTVFIFPPVLVDSDGRGLHDRVTGTAVILG
ncbi:RDD family protein [Corynebacterium sp. CCM 9185]|uniref:RDD family protein n=1 Tax=Corynebacterium marambiense TaxID=2765364 RepID=A0ABS0VVV8_9CORY|nr:RDD family protein [Corynebacterium marambiense]MBI9000913.1 RDD family protein [Corynebacterium marambiense]MCK7662819.1 RDD family protein [Corynebacterium marambiense]MCX7542428.1 RDD family protein [Corynebacterium marambiense]